MGFGPDDRIANYRVERELGTTATAVLYQAVHLVLPRRALIKVMHPARSQSLAVQLLREACILEALQHPGVPQVFESGLLGDKQPWFACEMIEGMTLSERIVNGPLLAVEVAMLVRDLAGILEHAHKRGIVHRALRPDHVVIPTRRRGQSAIAIPDWSEARAHDAPSDYAALTPTRARPFLAPELVRGEPADDRADVFALGVLAYQSLTGVLPRGDSTLERAPDAPRELAALIDQMLAPDRFDRPTAAEIRTDLEWLADALAVELQTDEDEVAPSSSATLRIRRPRWTPPIPNSPNAALATVSGEILVKKSD